MHFSSGPEPVWAANTVLDAPRTRRKPLEVSLSTEESPGKQVI
jgi:hypothetical protein